MDKSQINLDDLYRIIGAQQVRIIELQTRLQRAEMENQKLRAEMNAGSEDQE